jgi:farnesyl diphosphate synthase
VRLQRLKTGALIGFSCEAGARLAHLDGAMLRAVGDYARTLGLAFQIKDDLLDVTQSSAQTGKDAGLDAAHGKATFVTLAGIAGAERRLLALNDEARAALDRLGPKALVLAELFEFVIQRRS